MSCVYFHFSHSTLCICYCLFILVCKNFFFEQPIVLCFLQNHRCPLSASNNLSTVAVFLAMQNNTYVRSLSVLCYLQDPPFSFLPISPHWDLRTPCQPVQWPLLFCKAFLSLPSAGLNLGPSCSLETKGQPTATVMGSSLVEVGHSVHDVQGSQKDCIEQRVEHQQNEGTQGTKETNFFEGVEKLLEVWFTRSGGGLEGSDLRNIPRWV